VSVAEGWNHSLALKSDGTVIGWGILDPPPPGLSNVVAIASRLFHSLVLRRDGTVVAWGSNSYGQTNVPVGLSNVVGIAAGQGHCLALKSDGTVVGWGNNSNGQTNVPAGLSNVVAIAAGGNDSLALKSDGRAIGWGSNPDYVETIVPVGLSNVVAIAAGGGTTYPPRSFAIRVKLRVASIGLSGQSAAIRFRTFSGQHYSVEYSPDLGPGSWVGLPGGDIQGNWPDTLVTDTNAVAGPAARFYRIKQLQ